MGWFALIESATQAMKTRKAFEVLSSKLHCEKGAILGLFITQANSCMSAMQVINRISRYDDLLEIFPKENIVRSKDIPEDIDDNLIIIDFWNSRNTSQMLKVVKTYDWDKIVIVIDEVDQGSLYNRLSFVHEVETFSDADISCMFITATISNFSDGVYKIYLEDQEKFKNSVVEKIINQKCVEKHHAKPHKNYVGTSWYKNTPNAWIKLVIPKKEVTETKKDYDRIILNTICKSIKELPDENKQLAFIVTSSIRSDHNKLAKRMFRLGFNVTIELNCTNAKNYTVKYNSDAGEIIEWNIPYNLIEKAAAAGELNTYTSDDDGCDFQSGIEGSEDITLCHVLQASLRMGTTFHKDIIKNTSADEKLKLLTIFRKLKNLTGDSRRPSDYPKDPKIAMICGNLASRGNTIQNPFIGFTFTSSLYYNNGKSPQRGAINTQMQGRSNGTLLESYTNPSGVQPIMISTKTIMRDALANEAIVLKKAEEIDNGELICLKDLVTADEWKKVIKKTDEKFEDEVVINKFVNNFNVKLTKIGIVNNIPNNAIIVTQFETLLNEEFKTKFSIDKIPTSSYALSSLLKSKNISANISYTEHSAKNVANFANYFKELDWANCEYHIIKVDETKFNVIKRNKEILEKMKDGLIVIHNHIGQLIMYKI